MFAGNFFVGIGSLAQKVAHFPIGYIFRFLRMAMGNLSCNDCHSTARFILAAEAWTEFVRRAEINLQVYTISTTQNLFRIYF